jgi:transcriptional regulator with XRE-family HTH domain
MDPAPDLLKAARIAIGLTQRELADAARIGLRSLTRVEAGLDLNRRLHRAVKEALETKGVTFEPDDGMSGPGFRVRPECLGRSRVSGSLP